MSHPVSTYRAWSQPPPRPRAPRGLFLLAPVPDDRTAAAMDDEHDAEQLIEDLLALLEAGMVVALDLGDQVRFAAVDLDDFAA
jgi:hypothetical protein